MDYVERGQGHDCSTVPIAVNVSTTRRRPPLASWHAEAWKPSAPASSLAAIVALNSLVAVVDHIGFVSRSSPVAGEEGEGKRRLVSMIGEA